MKYMRVVGLCQYCGKEIRNPSHFRDMESLKEFMISGMCQECQDKVFTED